MYNFPGKVVAVTALTASQFSDTISINTATVEKLYAKFGKDLDEKLKASGIANGVAELTQSQARELAKLSPDTLGNRLAEAGRSRIHEILLRGAGAGLRNDAGVSTDGERRFSIEGGRPGLFPQLRGLSDDELIAAAVAARVALGKSDERRDHTLYVDQLDKMIRRLHPDWTNSEVSFARQRVMTGARRLGKQIRDDLDRGVSESLVLKHIPDTLREQFGSEFRQEARKGARLGAFTESAREELESRRERLIADAVRAETGIDAALIEREYGIDLSRTLMDLAENDLRSKPPVSVGGESAGADGDGGAADAAPLADEAVTAKARSVVESIVAASRKEAERAGQNRQNRRDAAGRDAERAEELGGEEGGAGGFGTDEALAAAIEKEGLNLANPRHLAEFVKELARRRWVKEHSLALDADPSRDLVFVQYLRKTVEGIYTKLVNDLCYSRGRDTATRAILKLDAVPTVRGLISEMEFIGAVINRQRIWETQQSLCEQLDLYLRSDFSAQGRFKPDREEGQRKVSAEAEQKARYMRHAMWLTPDKAAEESAALQEKLNVLSTDFGDAGRDVDQSRAFVEAIRELNILREFGALRYKPVGEIDKAIAWWHDYARGEGEEIAREMSDREIRTRKAAHLLAVAFSDPKRSVKREGKGAADAFNRYIVGHMGFVSLLQDCTRHASDDDRDAVKDIIGYIAREVQKAGDRTAAERRRHNDAFKAAVERIYGKSFNAVMRDMMAQDDRFAPFMGEVGGKKDMPTRARAMQLLVSLLQEGRKVGEGIDPDTGETVEMWEGGYHDNIVRHGRTGQASQLARLMSPADMNMVKWLGDWYEQNRSELSDVCKSLFGIGVYAELPNYFPVKMRLDKQGLEKVEGVGWTIFPKALTPRVKNERDFDTSMDIFSMWAARMEEGAQWKHHAKLGLEMRGIFGRAELQASVIGSHGTSVNDLMQGFITDILAGHGAYDRTTGGVEYFSDQVRGWTALCALGGNVGVMLKQTTSIPAFGFEIGLADTARHVVSAFSPEGIAAMRALWDSEQRKTRWQFGSSEAVQNALHAANASALKRMFQASMITNKLGDVVPGLVVGQGIYRDALARGLSADDAMAETWSIIERTQQSGRVENQTQVQRRNKLGRAMYQFLSTQQQYLQYEARAIREVIARPDSVRRWGALGRVILLNHFVLSSAYYWMGELYKACLGQEPPEDELRDWVISCLLGPYGSLYVLGFIGKATLERALKGYSPYGGSSMLPMEQWLKTQINDGARLVEALFASDGDAWDEMLDAAGKWMGDVNSTVRDLSKLYQNRIKDE